MFKIARFALIGALASCLVASSLALSRNGPKLEDFAVHSPTVALQSSSPPPSNLIYSALYVPATHTVAPVLGYRVTTIVDLFKIKGLSPDLFILGGYDVVKSKITGGFVLIFSRPIATNVTAQFGPGVATTTDGKPHFAVSASINIRT